MALLSYGTPVLQNATVSEQWGGFDCAVGAARENLAYRSEIVRDATRAG